MTEKERQSAFKLLRAEQALDTANSILNEQGILGILVDSTSYPTQYEEDHILALIEE